MVTNMILSVMLYCAVVTSGSTSSCAIIGVSLKRKNCLQSFMQCCCVTRLILDLGGSIETRVSLVWCVPPIEAGFHLKSAQVAGINHPPAVSLQVGIRGISLTLLTYRAPGFPLCSNRLHECTPSWLIPLKLFSQDR